MKRFLLLFVMMLPAPRVSVASVPPAAATIDQLASSFQERHRSKEAAALRAAYQALSEGGYAKARKSLEALSPESPLADYRSFLLAEAHRREAEAALAKQAWAQAIKPAQLAVAAYLSVLEKEPYSPIQKRLTEELARTELVLGQAHYRLGTGNQKRAIELLERGFSRLGQSGLYRWARSDTLRAFGGACAKSPTVTCQLWVQRLLELYPKNAPEYQALAKIHPQIASRSRPAAFSGKLTQTYKSHDKDQIAIDEALELTRQEKWKDAIRSFEQFLELYPKSGHRYRARFWLARALEIEEGTPNERAATIYRQIMAEAPLSYYGLLSSLEIEMPIAMSIDAALPAASDNEPALYAAETIALDRAQKLVAESAPELAFHDLNELKAKDNYSSPFILYLATLQDQVGNHTAAFQMMTELVQRGYPGVYSTYGLRLIFPVVHKEPIDEYALKHQLDPTLVMSLIKQESAFDALAVSHVGARGLMQLMPFTALDVDSAIEQASLNTPAENIRLGTKYLRSLINRYNGNLVYSLAGYNAGPGAVDKWIRASQPKWGILEFIESIPYKETREYVSSIIRNYFWYSYKMFGESPSVLDFFWNTYGPPQPAQSLKRWRQPSSKAAKLREP